MQGRKRKREIERKPDEGGKRRGGDGKVTEVRQGGTSDLGAPRFTQRYYLYKPCDSAPIPSFKKI